MLLAGYAAGNVPAGQTNRAESIDQLCRWLYHVCSKVPAPGQRRLVPPSSDPSTPRTICRPTVLPSVRAALLAMVSARLSPRRPPEEPVPMDSKSPYQVVAFGAGC